MIVVLTTAGNVYPIKVYLETHGAPLRHRIVHRAYPAVLDDRDPPPAAWVFADLELLSDEDRARAAELHARLAARGDRILNHPVDSLRRHDLVRAFHDRGFGRFTCWRATAAPPRPPRFPVFLRNESDHAGARSPLLENQRDLDRALARLPSLADVLVVEFCDTADATGLYRKYGAFRVGDRILARHLFFSRHWMLKDWDLFDGARLHEELAYVASNPHAAELRAAFDAARIDYGRIDYAFTPDGAMQVWEINTNPVIAGVGPLDTGLVPRALAALRRRARPLLERLPFAGLFERPRRPRAAVHALFARGLADAWVALDGAG